MFGTLGSFTNLLAIDLVCHCTSIKMFSKKEEGS